MGTASVPVGDNRRPKIEEEHRSPLGCQRLVNPATRTTWGSEDLMYGYYPEARDHTKSGRVGAGQIDKIMVKDLTTVSALSIHLHPGPAAASILWRLKHDPSISTSPQFAAELPNLKDGRSKDEVFLVIEADRHNFFTLGWHLPEVRALQARLGFDESELNRAIAENRAASYILQHPRRLCVEDLLFHRADAGARQRCARLRASLGKDKSLRSLGRKFRTTYESLVAESLDQVTAHRSATCPLTLTCIMLIIAFHALQQSVAYIDAHGFSMTRIQPLVAHAGDAASEWPGPKHLSEISPICDFFIHLVDLIPGTLIRVPAGVVHGAGSGLRLVEISENSLTTLRCYDHGQRADRPLHPLLAAVALSDVSDSQAPLIEALVNPIRTLCVGQTTIRLTDHASGEPVSESSERWVRDSEEVIVTLDPAKCRWISLLVIEPTLDGLVSQSIVANSSVREIPAVNFDKLA